MNISWMSERVFFPPRMHCSVDSFTLLTAFFASPCYSWIHHKFSRHSKGMCGMCLCGMLLLIVGFFAVKKYAATLTQPFNSIKSFNPPFFNMHLLFEFFCSSVARSFIDYGMKKSLWLHRVNPHFNVVEKTSVCFDVRPKYYHTMYYVYVKCVSFWYSKYNKLSLNCFDSCLM